MSAARKTIRTDSQVPRLVKSPPPRPAKPVTPTDALKAIDIAKGQLRHAMKIICDLEAQIAENL